MTIDAVHADQLRRAADAAAYRLARPTAAVGGHPQSLSHGAAGVALLHAERAASGLGDWNAVHAWLQEATRFAIVGGSETTLFFGAPAVAYALHTAARTPARYPRALTALDTAVAAIVEQRLTQAHARIGSGARPAPAEYDVIQGLTGLGAHLRRRHPDSDLLRRVLAYLVRLTRPLAADDPLPGWWTDQAPTGRRAAGHPAGGYGNLSMAHGICGPLALLSLTARDGTVIDGQHEAIARICSWLDTWRQEHPAGPWWPEIVTRDDVLTGHARQTRPSRPAWCYGTAGHARAQQLAGLALGDTNRRHTAERALTGCLTDPARLARLSGPGLCHGTAGLFQTTRRAAADAASTDLRAHLPDLAHHLLAAADSAEETGLLDGAAGCALALTTAAHAQPPATGWDSFLLVT
jgi:hypothetical protein